MEHSSPNRDKVGARIKRSPSACGVCGSPASAEKEMGPSCAHVRTHMEGTQWGHRKGTEGTQKRRKKRRRAPENRPYASHLCVFQDSSLVTGSPHFAASTCSSSCRESVGTAMHTCPAQGPPARSAPGVPPACTIGKINSMWLLSVVHGCASFPRQIFRSKAFSSP